MSNEESRNGGCGCFTAIMFCLFVWVLCFGFTYEKKHYGLSCSFRDGVALEVEGK